MTILEWMIFTLGPNLALLLALGVSLFGRRESRIDQMIEPEKVKKLAELRKRELEASIGVTG